MFATADVEHSRRFEVDLTRPGLQVTSEGLVFNKRNIVIAIIMHQCIASGRSMPLL